MVSHVANVGATMDADGGVRRGEWAEMGCAQGEIGCAQAEMGCAQAEMGCAQAERERVGMALNWAGAAMVAD